MKNFLLCFLALLLCVSLSACKQKQPSDGEMTTEYTTQESTTDAVVDETVPVSETTSAAETTELKTEKQSTVTATKTEKTSVTETRVSTVAEVTDTEKNTISVFLSVDCGNAVNAGNELAIRIAFDGVILSEKEFELEKGASVYDLTMQSGLVIGSQASAYGKYVYSINSLSERDCGSMSGWIYRVNGVVVQKACSVCELQDGDRVEWIYTLNGGKDIAS